MRVGVLNVFRIRMARSAAILALAGFAAGCSSDVVRFDDGFYTGAVPQSASGVDQVNTGSINRGGGLNMPTYRGTNPGAGIQTASAAPNYPRAMPADTAPGYALAQPSANAPVQRATLAPPNAPGAAPAYQPPQPPALPAPTATASLSKPATSAGWNQSGNRVTLRGGETVYSLSKRYGVPAKAILEANNMRSAEEARAGQELVIPAYTYGKGAPVSAPDHDPRTRQAAVVPAPGEGYLKVPGSSAPAPRQTAAAESRPAAPQAGGGAGRTVTVESGDTLASISRRTGAPVDELRRLNNVSGDHIRVGQMLFLPSDAKAAPTRVASLEPADARSDASAAPAPAARVAPMAKAAEPKPAQPKSYEPPRAAEAKPEAPAKVSEPRAETPVANEIKTESAAVAPAATGISQFRWPVQGRVVKGFGDKVGTRRNDGLNISVPRGTPVKAAENGVVIYAGDGLKEFGNTVLVKHDNGLVTVYGYADALNVKRGDTVTRGQEIATAGMTGETDVPMLHFEVRKNSAPVDPMTFLR